MWPSVASSATSEKGGEMRVMMVLAVLMLVSSGCMSIQNTVYIYVNDSNATITSDGGSQAKPIDIGRGLKIPLGGF